MKTKTTITTMILIAISTIAFSLNQKKSNPENKSDCTSFKNEKYISINGDLFIIMDTMDKNAIPVKLSINTKFEESNPVISSDGNTLYFVSDRKGGYGGKDIWASERFSDGTWCKPYNLGSMINTSLDEDHPVILNDGVTLMFSSNGRDNNNEMESFSSTLNDEGLWTLPEKTE